MSDFVRWALTPTTFAHVLVLGVLGLGVFFAWILVTIALLAADSLGGLFAQWFLLPIVVLYVGYKLREKSE